METKPKHTNCLGGMTMGAICCFSFRGDIYHAVTERMVPPLIPECWLEYNLGKLGWELVAAHADHSHLGVIFFTRALLESLQAFWLHWPS